jgi:tetratricopeptide (TPR) repeat protein
VTVIFSFALLAAEVCTVPAPGGAAGQLELGECFLSNQQWQQAEQHLRSYLRQNPNCARGTALHAQALVKLGHPFDAVLEVEEFLEGNPDSAPVLKVYAALLEKVVKDLRKSGEVLEKLTKLTPGDAEIWRTLGTHYLTKQLPDQALRSYRQAARLAPDDAIAAAGLGAAYGKMDRHAEADVQFARAIRLNQRSPQPSPLVYLICAESLFDANRTAESLAMAGRALMLDPHSIMGYYWRAASYERREDYRHAEGDALAALREGGQDYRQVHGLLLRIYRSEHKAEAAEREAAEVARLAGAEKTEQERAAAVRTILHEAEPLLKQGRFAEAASAYEGIVKALPTFYEAYFALGVCYSQTSRPVEAEAAFRTFLRLQPLSTDGHAALGVLLASLKRTGEAKHELEEALRLDSRQTEARRVLARMYMADSEFSRAVKVLRPGAGSPEADGAYRLMLAESLFRSGETTAALKEIDEVTAADPANAAAAELRRRVLGR